MTPASEIIKRLGGNLAVANLLGLERTAIQRWTYPSPRGLDNRVPQRHWVALVEASDGKVSLDELMSNEVAEIIAAQQQAAA
jgi:DNA-binding transcriptional regulator YdaS (Cro superfamily)